MEICADDFRGNPKKRSTEKNEADSLLRQSLHHPGEKTDRASPHRGDEQQDGPSRGGGHTAVNREDFRDPGNAGQHKNQAVQETAEKSNAGPGTEQAEKKNGHAKPGIKAWMLSVERERKDCAAEGREKQTCDCGKFRGERRSQTGIPGRRRHQCFTTNALKPALSRPFFAASAL